MSKGDEQRKDNCKFVGYSAEFHDVADVCAAYVKIARLHPEALHIACAYRLPGVDFLTLRGYEDDGEHGAGRVLFDVLEKSDIFHRAIFVVCFYGNKHIGPTRFHLTQQTAQSATSKSASNSIPKVYQMPWQGQNVAVKTFLPIRGGGRGYTRAAPPPRPYLARSVQRNWGNHKSLQSAGTDVSEVNRPYTNSADSSYRFASVT